MSATVFSAVDMLTVDIDEGRDRVELTDLVTDWAPYVPKVRKVGWMGPGLQLAIDFGGIQRVGRPEIGRPFIERMDRGEESRDASGYELLNVDDLAIDLTLRRDQEQKKWMKSSMHD